MSVGEKIKYYRELRGLTQSKLSSASGASLAAIKKYESGDMLPSKTVLKNISNALNIKVSAFHDSNIESASDITPYLLLISQVCDIQFNGSKDSAGKYDINDLSISFKSPVIMQVLKEWADKLSFIEHIKKEALNSHDSATSEFLINRATQLEQELELQLVEAHPSFITEKK